MSEENSENLKFQFHAKDFEGVSGFERDAEPFELMLDGLIASRAAEIANKRIADLTWLMDRVDSTLICVDKHRENK